MAGGARVLWATVVGSFVSRWTGTLRAPFGLTTVYSPMIKFEQSVAWIPVFFAASPRCPTGNLLLPGLLARMSIDMSLPLTYTARTARIRTRAVQPLTHDDVFA